MKDTGFPFEIRLTEKIVQDFHEQMAVPIMDGAAAVLAASNPGGALVDADGVFAIGGIYPRWPGVGLAWSILDPRRMRRHARATTEAAKAGIERADCRRVEAAVLCDFGRGHAWMRHLGFKREAKRMEAWGTDGLDYALYAKVKPWHPHS